MALAVGEWGGDHIRLTVKEAGAEIEMDCAHGFTDSAISVDADGRFDAAGRFVRERGGPVRRSDDQGGVPARYKGSRKQDAITLEIVFADGRREGPYTLTRASRGRIVKCR